MLAEKSVKIRKEYFCNNCNYKTCDKKDYNKHLLTTKHKNNMIIDISLTNLEKKSEKSEKSENKNNMFFCKCGKNYKSRQGFYLHKKKCMFIDNEENNCIIKSSDISNNQLTLSNDVVLKLLNDNQELKNIIVQQQNQLLKQQEQFSELIPKVGNTNNTINNNQKFNINVFLNEQCKDAINLSDFIKSLHVTLEQLDFTKQNGLADGISKTIIDNMSKLSIYERPMHCTDVKRETLYIKDQDGWEKDKSKTKIKDALKSLSNEHYKLIREWMNENPDFKEVDSKQDYFARIIKECGAKFDNISDKLVKKICNNSQLKDDLKDLDNTFLE